MIKKVTIEGTEEDLIQLIKSAVIEVINELQLNSSNHDIKEVMTVKELSNYIGASVQTIYNKKNSGDIPYSKKLGLRFIKKDIDAWLKDELENHSITKKN